MAKILVHRTVRNTLGFLIAKRAIEGIGLCDERSGAERSVNLRNHTLRPVAGI